MNNLIFRLSRSNMRKYELCVYEDLFSIQGDFWYLKDKEFYSSKTKEDTASIKDFLGIGYLSKRSYRKTVLFVVGATFLETMKLVIDKITEWIDKANDYLQWVDKSISLPAWIDNTLNTTAIICLILGVVLFFSKKKVIEISFTTKRICVPQKSMTTQEYNMLYSSIKKAKENR